MGSPLALVLSCEHAGNRIPAAYRRLFPRSSALLESHRGYDRGALELARLFSRALKVPLDYCPTSRLLADANRSPGNPAVFSKWTRSLPSKEKARILENHHAPYWASVEKKVRAYLKKQRRVIHLSIHTFTPVLAGVRRTADIGLLYDPVSRLERDFIFRWQERIEQRLPHLKVRRNYPYRGTSDGLVRALRRTTPAGRYAGIELEVNQRLLGKDWPEIRKEVVASLKDVME